MIVYLCPHCRANLPPFLAEQLFNCEACGKLVRPGEAHSVVREKERAGPRTRAWLRALVLLLLLALAVAALLWVNPGEIRETTYDRIEALVWTIRGKTRPTAPEAARPDDPATAAAPDSMPVAPDSMPATADRSSASARPAPTPASAAIGSGADRRALLPWLRAELERGGIYAYVTSRKTTLVIRSPRCATDLLPGLAATPELHGAIERAGFRLVECRTAAGIAGSLEVGRP